MSIPGLSRRDFLKLSATGSAGALMASCQSAREEGMPVAVMMLGDLTQVRWSQADLIFFENGCQEEGIVPLMQNGQDDVRVQASQVENMITMGVDAVALAAVEMNAGTDMVRKFKQAGIPVLVYNNAIPNCDADFLIARDPVQIGRRLAQAAIDDVGATGNWLKISGDQGNSVAQLTTQGVFEVIQPHIDSGAITLVDFQWHPGWSGDLALKTTEQALIRTNNDIQVILSDNDGMAYGCLRALVAQGLEGNVWLCGVDAEIEACRQILLGNMAVSNWSWFDRMGYTGAKICAAMIRGENYPYELTQNNGTKDVPWIPVENINVTKENIVEWLPQVQWWAPAQKVVEGVSEALWPSGLRELLPAA